MSDKKQHYVELSVDDTVFEQPAEAGQQHIEVDLDLLRTDVPEHVLNAVAATVGSSRFRQYTVMGDTVNLAQRLESAAARDQILVSASVVQACQGRIDFVEHEAIRV